ncbi:MAG: glycosyl transferase [Oryzomonas sp.]|jgi:hypothetical protein
MKAKGPDLWDRIFSDATAKAVFIASILYVVWVTCVGWNGKLADLYAFRQTQTAISVSYLLKGGPWLAYETPVLGPPWSIPFEFPLYQWIVALVAKTGLFAIDQAGRFVSEFFFFSSLYPLYKLLGFLKLSSRQRYLILAIFCISPQYLFWSRSFMIESTAIALSVYYLWLVFVCCKQLAAGRLNRLTLTGVAVLGAMASMVKVTTFFSFLVGACIVVAVFAFKTYREEGVHKRTILLFCLLVFAAVIIPFLAVSGWTAYADSLKSLNPLASGFTSSGLRVWNFGTFEQKFSIKTWQTFYFRILTDLVGNCFLATATVAAVVFCRKERAIVAIISLGLFVLTLLTFTNLQYVHTYYSYANGIFFLVAVGIIVSDLLESRNNLKRVGGITLFCLCLFFSTQHFFNVYWPFQNQYFDFKPITSAIDTYSGDDDVFIVFGSTWSSEIPYYIKRRAAMINNLGLNDPALRALKEKLRGYRIGGLLFYTRNGFVEGTDAFVDNALRYFGVTPGFYSVYPWYKSNSEILIVFNGAK